MSHAVYFGKVSKRKNSTLQPSLSTSFDVLFKTPTSLDRPTFTLSADSFDYNYAKMGDRYYFVTDIVSRNNDLWEVSCELDPLATFKTNILNTTAYVLYDSVINTEIPDNRLPMKTSKTVAVNSVACPLSVDGGCYILSLTGSHDTTGVYKVSESELSSLIDDVSDISDNFFPQTTPPTPPSNPSIEDLLNFIGDTIQFVSQRLHTAISNFFGSGNIPENIRECKFIPFNRGVSGAATQIYLGTFKTNVSLRKLTTDTIVDSVNVAIPWQATDYRRRSPYTDIYLYIPYIGMVKLSSENLIGQTSVNVQYALCVRDGSLIVTISSGSEIIGQYSSNVAASVPVGFSNINLPRAAQSIISGIGNAVSNNPIGAGMSALSFTESITPNFSCLGGLDGMAGTATNQNVTCYTVYHDTIAQPNQNLQVIGAPSMCSKSLATLTGFCQCLDAHVSASAEGNILDQIDAYLNSGFYIE